MNPRNPARSTHGAQISSDVRRTVKGVWDALTDPEHFFDCEDPERANEPILSGAECPICGDAPLTRADGLQVRCPQCGQMHPPKVVTP